MFFSKKWLFFLFVACSILLGIDIGTKYYVVSHISPFQGVSVFRDWLGIDFFLEYVKNTGAAWGILASLKSFLLWGRCLIIIAIFFYLIFYRLSLLRTASLSVVVSGAIGNVLDFFLYGHVVDMFHFRFWGHSFAVFNVADSMIFCGVVFLFLEQALEKRVNKRLSKEKGL